MAAASFRRPRRPPPRGDQAQTTRCTVACQNTWKWCNGSRLGVQIGSGYTVTRSWLPTGVKTVTVDLSESCVESGGRLVCHSLSYVYVNVVAPPAVAKSAS